MYSIKHKTMFLLYVKPTVKAATQNIISQFWGLNIFYQFQGQNGTNEKKNPTFLPTFFTLGHRRETFNISILP